MSSLYVCMVNIKLKYNLVVTPRQFTIAELSIRKLVFSSVSQLSLLQKLCDDKLTWCFHKIIYFKRSGAT